MSFRKSGSMFGSTRKSGTGTDDRMVAPDLFDLDHHHRTTSYDDTGPGDSPQEVPEFPVSPAGRGGAPMMFKTTTSGTKVALPARTGPGESLSKESESDEAVYGGGGDLFFNAMLYRTK